MPDELTLLIGSYTRPEAHVPAACGEGIVTLAFDTATGRVERRQVFNGIVNPSYLAFDAARRHVFAVSENITADGEVWQFSLGEDGKLIPLARQSSHGAATCHVVVLPDDRIGAASYLGGCLAVYPLQDGLLAPSQRVFNYAGGGANPLRQEAPHAHQGVVAPNRKWFYVCDLGADCVWRHDIAAQADPVGQPMPAGHGPRHMVFHPTLPRAWVVGELTGSVATCDWDAKSGTLEVIATTPLLGDDAAAAAIRVHPSHRTLWISLRASRSLLAFSLDANGMPGATTRVALKDGEPRDFAISPDGRWLVVANQSADELVVIALDRASGLPGGARHQHFPIGTPVCALFLTKNTDP